MLKVKNKSDIDLSDRFNGQDYHFPKGGSVALNEEAARHIFGFGDPDKTPYLIRQGWMKRSDEYGAAMRILSGFAFSAIDLPDEGELQQDEQGLAPLHLGAVEETASDGAVESSVPIPTKKRSVLSQLSGSQLSGA